MKVSSRDFRADAGTKVRFPAMNSPNNGKRARSLLCGREALSNELCEAVGVQIEGRIRKGVADAAVSCPRSEQQRNFVRTKFRVSGSA